MCLIYDTQKNIRSNVCKRFSSASEVFSSSLYTQPSLNLWLNGLWSSHGGLQKTDTLSGLRHFWAETVIQNELFPKSAVCLSGTTHASQGSGSGPKTATDVIKWNMAGREDTSHTYVLISFYLFLLWVTSWSPINLSDLHEFSFCSMFLNSWKSYVFFKHMICSNSLKLLLMSILSHFFNCRTYKTQEV